jgi:hypothetical protein
MARPSAWQTIPPMTSRSLCLLISVLALLVGAAAAHAAKTPVCAKGQIVWNVEGRPTCAPALKPSSRHAAQLLARRWVRSGARLSRRMPKRLRRAASRVATVADKATVKGTAAAVRPRARAAAVRARPRAAAGGAPAIYRETVTAPEGVSDGITVGGKVTATLFQDESYRLDYELSAKDRNGNGALFRPIMGDALLTKPTIGCPTSAGLVTADDRLTLGGTIIAMKHDHVIESATNKDTLVTHTRGQVGPDARLARVDTDLAFTEAYYRRGVQIEYTFKGTATSARDGAITFVGRPSVDVKVRVAGATAKEERAFEREKAAELVRDPDMPSALADATGTARDRMRDGEKTWYDLPNDCAGMRWSPEPVGKLDKGVASQVEGWVVSKKDGGKASAGQVNVTVVHRGAFDTLRAEFGTDANALFKATGGEPDDAKDTVFAQAIATSTAGRAERAWIAEGSAQEWPLRIGGPISLQQDSDQGYHLAFNGRVEYDLQDVKPNPDGTKTIRYEMSFYDLPYVHEEIGKGCGYEGTGADKGWTDGWIDATQAKDGSVTYSMVVWVKIENVAMSSFGCDPPQAPYTGTIEAYMKTGSFTAGSGFHLKQDGATELQLHQIGTGTASWDLATIPAFE